MNWQAARQILRGNERKPMYQGLSEASRQQGVGGALGGTVASAPVREPEIARRVQALDNQTAMTCEAVRHLMERLGAISRPTQPSTDSGAKEVNELCHSDVGNFLMGVERRLVMLQRAAEDALNRLEI